MQLLDKLKDLHTQLYFLIEQSKAKYYSRITSKVCDVGKNSKTYWSILKSFLIGKKIPYIPPLFENNEYNTDSRKKGNYSNHFLQTRAS